MVGVERDSNEIIRAGSYLKSELFLEPRRFPVLIILLYNAVSREIRSCLSICATSQNKNYSFITPQCDEGTKV